LVHWDFIFLFGLLGLLGFLGVLLGVFLGILLGVFLGILLSINLGINLSFFLGNCLWGGIFLSLILGHIFGQRFDEIISESGRDFDSGSLGLLSEEG
jgi:hypothetical protein